MMVLCKRSVNSFLGMAGISAEEEKFESCKCGLGLITSESQRPANIIESSVLKSTNLDPTVEELKKEPGWVGFIDVVGGQADGLMSCMESLGFESCVERRFDDGIGMGFCEGRKVSTSSSGRARSGRERWRERKKKFPGELLDCSIVSRLRAPTLIFSRGILGFSEFLPFCKFCSSFRSFGPNFQKPSRCIPNCCRFGVVGKSGQRNWFLGSGWDP